MARASLFENAVDRIRGAFRRGRRGTGHRERHRKDGSAVHDVVFGANDGLVSNAALVAGVAGGASDPGVILLGGVAGLVAGTISMALGAYVSTKSQREHHQSEQARERWEVEHMREQEIEETRRIFRQKGVPEPLLEEVVEAVSRSPDQWVQLMMTDELGFPKDPPKPLLSALVMGLSFAAAAAVPVAPYFAAEGAAALIASFGLSGAALFGVGMWRASLGSGRTLRKGAEMVALAGAAVAAAYLIGSAVGVAV